MKRLKFSANQKVAKREIITDQSDPRMIKFRKENGEFEPGYSKGNTVKLVITEYEAGPDEFQVTTVAGYHDGPPDPAVIALIRGLMEKAMVKMKEEKDREELSQKLNISFRVFRRKERKAVLELWKKCKLTQPWEEPAKDIYRRIKDHSDLFLVCLNNENIIATVMGRCDENRGWIEYLAVDPAFRKKGIGRQLVKLIEERLSKMGCIEIGFLIQNEGEVAADFYQKTGYSAKSVTYLHKHLR
jgi:ribosomal protein S18 acetylase RimI-like enzyme